MSNTAIQVQNLSKRYRIGAQQQGASKYKSLREELTKAIRAPIRRAGRLLRGEPYGAAELDEAIWALKDVSFEIEHGEAVGIIGPNGAGKTTLLKILSRITEPTEGRAVLHGRVGSLLEVGTGFHPELTGRENIYLNGAILGMTKTEIERKFDEIVAFSGVEQFINTPVKHYSSGMRVRLAFSVAAHLDPEILLIDEVLAVGDAAFQKKCLGKMQNVANTGRTVLFVSHNMSAVRGLCERTILLDRGHLAVDDDSEIAIQRYIGDGGEDTMHRSWDDPLDAPGNETARVVSINLEPELQGPGEPITTRTPVRFLAVIENLVAGAVLSMSIVVRRNGQVAFSSPSLDNTGWWGKPMPAGSVSYCCRIPGDLLNNGTHDVQVYLVENQRRVIWRSERDILTLHVEDCRPPECDWYGNWLGPLRPILEWQVTPAKSAASMADR